MRRRPAPRLAVAAAALLLAGCVAPSGPERRNWFNDPFFVLSSGLPGCAEPLGPLLTFEEQRREAHWRAERGTSCWLAGQCQDSNAYRYDPVLAPRVQAALAAVPGVARSSVWVTLQRRWVFLEGCVDTAALADALEQAARAVPEVEAVVPALGVGVREAPRYPTLAPAAAP